MTKLLQQCFLFFIVVVILGHNLDNSQVSVYRTIGPTLVIQPVVCVSDLAGNTESRFAHKAAYIIAVQKSNMEMI